MYHAQGGGGGGGGVGICQLPVFKIFIWGGILSDIRSEI